MVVGFVGFIIANLLSDVVRNAAKTYGANVANVLAGVSRWSILIFTGLIVLNQLGIKPELLQILTTGIVVALALAIGLVFGLGGQDAARQILKRLIDSAHCPQRRGK